MDIVTPSRITAMANAIELGVDVEDFRFLTAAETLVWADLCEQIHDLTEKDDLVWLSCVA